ncbi:hypothetical protein COX95_01870 [bacterium CG_4_10_14_0_2_um_filter_33_32]|nr:MAG: hypothetical protein AUJ93_04315 [bacterium CG2_30_33_46]PIR67732.1 MAG: hypothetical protein COU50_01720 [bacterium CG10_big_fil_rev_8_21_14_0_10_33_18]PIU77205.1 MAG: hypothetical protein COS74_00115 [bacterium CG06_land_8_20_14_3_00_33_50]PIW80976.1 MAG: hypothetical protein COZ97_04130 [bacterium CG_4_8_14_3_um_filter_33_28]PIY85286.1 MAG: hypothetical protein COY76_03045 [bacterium CG_4_10_14_0_8_um_filter_33_57]PIZ86187.1 MAG: hypothetical protein COX95_01870 [bacterium CG_4_10_1
MENKLIYETKNFIAEAVSEPHVSREDGGHIRIVPKRRVVDRTALSPKEATEMARLIMLAGEAMVKGLNNRGIDIGRINYQDNGNWSVFSPQGSYLHIHLYGRAKSAPKQKYGDSLHFPHRETGFYDNAKPMDDDDITEIQRVIEELLKEDKYKESNWGLE